MTVWIVGVGMTRLGKHTGRSVKALVAEAVGAALADANCDPGAVQAAWFCNARWGIFEAQHGIRGQVVVAALRAVGAGEPMVRITALEKAGNDLFFDQAPQPALGAKFADMALGALIKRARTRVLRAIHPAPGHLARRCRC